jgi:hypothetical protein
VLQPAYRAVAFSIHLSPYESCNDDVFKIVIAYQCSDDLRRKAHVIMLITLHAFPQYFDYYHSLSH